VDKAYQLSCVAEKVPTALLIEPNMVAARHGVPWFV
jgi:hypothetical protein